MKKLLGCPVRPGLMLGFPPPSPPPAHWVDFSSHSWAHFVSVHPLAPLVYWGPGFQFFDLDLALDTADLIAALLLGSPGSDPTPFHWERGMRG